MFKVKYQADSSLKRFKPHLVTQGFFQVHKIDYTEMFAPIIRRESLRIFLTIALILEMILFQMDIIDAYLESPLRQGDYLIYMKIP